MRTPFNEGSPTFFPDGRWLAYASDASGRYEIYVQPCPIRGPAEDCCYAGQAASRGERFEVSAIKAVRPTLVNTLAALKKGDIARARAAFGAYDSGWNGIEMYINTRDKSMYDELEKNLQERITKGLASANPDVAALTSDAQMMLAKYDEAIGNVERAAPLNPLYDDIAKARKSAAAFSGKLGSVDGLIKARSPEASDAVAKGTAELMSALKADKPDTASDATAAQQSAG